MEGKADTKSLSANFFGGNIWWHLFQNTEIK